MTRQAGKWPCPFSAEALCGLITEIVGCGSAVVVELDERGGT